MIQYEEICDHINWHSNPMVGSREIMQAGYLQKVGRAMENEDRIKLCGICLRESRLTDLPHKMETTLSKPFPGRVINASCSCDGGASGKCKHVVAMLKYASTYVLI